MEEIWNIICINLEKVGLGIGLFLVAFLANTILGIWKSLSIDNMKFDWHKLLQGFIKFGALALGIGLLTISMSLLPLYVDYVGITLEHEILETIDILIIITAFLIASIRYIKDALSKLKAILGNP